MRESTTAIRALNFRPGDVVFAQVLGQIGNSVWPGQIASAVEASDEALCKQQADCLLVCLYHVNKWIWLPAHRIEDFDGNVAKHPRSQGGCKAWQQAWEEAKEASDRAKGRAYIVRHNPPLQLQAKPTWAPAASIDMVFGLQQHPRAMTLMSSLQKSAQTLGNQNAGIGQRNAGVPDATQVDAVGNGLHAVGKGVGASSIINHHKVIQSIPAWPEYIHETHASRSDVEAVDAANVLDWIRCMAKGSLPTSSMSAEQEVSARKQLTSFDQARRTEAFEKYALVAGLTDDLHATSAGHKPTSKKSSKAQGLAAGTHSLQLPEEVAKQLAPVQDHLKQDHGMSAWPPGYLEALAKITDPSERRKIPGGNTLMGASVIDVVLRVNGEILPFTCPATVQTFAQINANAVPGVNAALPPLATPVPPAVSLHHRVGGLHAVLQQLLCAPTSTSSSQFPSSPRHEGLQTRSSLANGASASVMNAHMGSPASNGMPSGTGVVNKASIFETSKQGNHGPVVEGWKVLSPTKVMLSLSVAQALLQVTCTSRPPSVHLASSLAGAHAQDPALPASPHAATLMPAPMYSPSAALLTAHGVLLPIGHATKKRTRQALQASGDSSDGKPGHAGDDVNAPQRPPRISDGGVAGVDKPAAAPIVSSGLPPPSKKLRKSDKPTDDTGNTPAPTHNHQHQHHTNKATTDSHHGKHNQHHTHYHQHGRNTRRKNSLPSYVSPWSYSMRATPYDPADPFYHPSVPGSGNGVSLGTVLRGYSSFAVYSAVLSPGARQQSATSAQQAMQAQNCTGFSARRGASMTVAIVSDARYSSRDNLQLDRDEVLEGMDDELDCVDEPAQPGVLLIEVRVGAVKKRPFSPTKTARERYKQTCEDKQDDKQSSEKDGQACQQDVVLISIPQRKKQRTDQGLKRFKEDVSKGCLENATLQRAMRRYNSLLSSRSSQQLVGKDTPILQPRGTQHRKGSHAADLDHSGSLTRRQSSRPSMSEFRSPRTFMATNGSISGEGSLLMKQNSCAGVNCAAGRKGAADGGLGLSKTMSTPMAAVQVPATPTLDAPSVRASTPEGQQLQGLAEQLQHTAHIVSRLSFNTAREKSMMPDAGTLQVLTNFREKAAGVAMKIMVAALSSFGGAQLRSEPLQTILTIAREAIAACDAVETTSPSGQAVFNLSAFSEIASASAALLQQLKKVSDMEQQDDSEDDSEEEMEEEDDDQDVKGRQRGRGGHHRHNKGKKGEAQRNKSKNGHGRSRRTKDVSCDKDDDSSDGDEDQEDKVKMDDMIAALTQPLADVVGVASSALQALAAQVAAA